MKLLIADDEMQIRTGLAEGINWKDIGIKEVITAENGIEALEYCQVQKPDIIITDIRMPGITGLELGKRVTQLYQPVSIIILSGYSEFEYAREAIQLGAFDYLLKPINIKELIEQVIHARELLLEKKQTLENRRIAEKIKSVQRMEKILLESKEILQGEELKFFEEFIDLNSKKDMMLGMCVADQKNNINLEQFGMYLDTCLRDIIPKFQGQILLQKRDRIYFLLEVFTDTEYQRKCKKLCEVHQELNQILFNQFKTTMTMVVSPYGNLCDLPIWNQFCEKGLKQRMFRGQANFIETKDMSMLEQINISPVNPNKIKDNIAKLEYEYMHQYIREIFTKLQVMHVTSNDFVKGVCLELKNLLIGVMLDKGVDVESIFEKNQILLNEIPQYCCLEEYCQWIDNLYYLILNGLNQITGNQHSRMIIQAVDFISNNYAKDISLEITADYVNKSKNYFSYLFKKETGITFVEYLNQVRINQAKILLSSTDEMTYEISEKVGYRDYKYFSTIFKKNVGMSPSQYRKKDEIVKK